MPWLTPETPSPSFVPSGFPHQAQKTTIVVFLVSIRASSGMPEKARPRRGRPLRGSNQLLSAHRGLRRAVHESYLPSLAADVLGGSGFHLQALMTSTDEGEEHGGELVRSIDDYRFRHTRLLGCAGEGAPGGVAPSGEVVN